MYHSNLYSHSGGLDKSGGHKNSKTGEYHCHREPCFSNQLQVANATNDALRENRDFVSLYNRKDWSHWIDSDGDCQNTRQELLISSSLKEVTFKSEKSCTVNTGEWFDEYTGKTFSLATDVDIDHLVPLAHAHRSGGYSWSRIEKQAFANDPLNLLIVDDSTNQRKSDKAPNEWMPPRERLRCSYLEKWIKVKEKYNLQFSSNEVDYLSSSLSEHCPELQLNLHN